MAFIKATKRRHWTSTRSDSIQLDIRNAANSLYFGSSQVPEMARSSWMAKKFTRGMTYQWKAKESVNAREDLYGVANIVIYHYNEQLQKCCGSLGIGVPEQKRDIVKIRKLLRLLFGHSGVHHT